MSDQLLRELLEDRVADVDGRDLAGPAWARAEEVRRRRRYAVVGTAAAAVALVAGGVQVLGDGDAAERSPAGRPPTSSPSSSEEKPKPTPADGVLRAELAGTFRGAPFWWLPAAERDLDLPILQVPGLPDRLSMADEAPVTDPPDHVDAVFATAKQRYRLLSDGELVSVDLSDRLGPVGDGAGNAFTPLGWRSVSPDGTQVAFRQPGRVEVWDLPSNSWRTVQTPDYERVEWHPDGRLWTGEGPPPERVEPWTGPDVQYSPIVLGPGGTAELDFTGEGAVAPGADGPGRYANPELLVARQDGVPGVLGIGIDGRSKGCCALVGWFSHDFVLFVAASEGTSRVLAWRAGTADVYRVGEITDVPRQLAVASWAERAFL